MSVSLQDRAHRAFTHAYKDAITGMLDPTDGDVAEAVGHGVVAVIELVEAEHGLAPRFSSSKPVLSKEVVPF